MKKEGLKKEYDNIKISDVEKSKIYNSIMENRKKSFNWMPILGFGSLALASLAMFLLLGGNNTIQNEGTGNIALENNFRKEIITRANQYLSANNIDVKELEIGEELTIDSKEIIDNKEYKVCSGNLIIKRYNDDYSYTTDVTCGNNSDGKVVEFKLYNGFLRNVYELEDDVLVSSYTDYSYDEYNNLIDTDVNLTLFNNSGDINWNYKIESEFQDENSIVEVIGANKINNRYYIVYRAYNNIVLNSDGSGRKLSHDYILVLDENGNKEDSYPLKDENNNNIFISSCLGFFENKVYYDVYISDESNNQEELGGLIIIEDSEDLEDLEVLEDLKDLEDVEEYNGWYILEVSEEGNSVLKFEITDYNDELDTLTEHIIKSYSNGYFYGYVNEKSGFENENYDNQKTNKNKVYKQDREGKIILEKQIDVTEDYYIQDIITNDDKIYVICGYDGFSSILLEYNDNFELQNKIELSTLTNEELIYSRLLIENNKLIFELYKDDDYYFIVTDNNYSVEKQIKNTKEEVNENFAWSNLIYKKLKNDDVNMIYAVGQTVAKSDSILFAFYK